MGLNKPAPPPLLLSPDEPVKLPINSFVVTLKEGAEPHSVAHDLDCLYMNFVLDGFYWFRCGPNKEEEAISPPMTLPQHEAMLTYRQLTMLNPKYGNGYAF